MQLESQVAQLSVDNEAKRTKLGLLKDELQSWSASGTASGKGPPSEEFFKDQLVKKAFVKELESRIADEFLLKKSARYVDSRPPAPPSPMPPAPTPP